jgi:hypothetical protein
MRRSLRTLVVFLVLGAAGSLPAVASAQLDPADSISLTGLSATGGHAYVDYPFSFTGSGTVDGMDADDYDVEVLFTPSSSSILRGGCPSDFNATAQAIEEAFGGPDVIAEYSQEGITDPFLLEQGAFTYTAEVNGDVVPTVTAAGNYIACAYLVDDGSDETFAVSSPAAFTVSDAPGTGTAPTGFGGPPGSKEPSHLGLRVTEKHHPIRAPGRNLLTISGNDNDSVDTGSLIITVKPTRRYNGCAANDQEDQQIAKADGGAVLAYYESVSPSSSGNFSSPLALNFRKRVSESAVLCAYLVDGFGEDLAAGYLRFTPHPPRTTHRRTPKRHG